MSLRRRATNGRILLPASRSSIDIATPAQAYHLPTADDILTWTFGRGSVIRRIWLPVLIHTLFAVVVVTISLDTRIELAIPNVMLTVLGVVIGFVISYRALTGYDKYWQGRTCWSDVMKNARILSRLIWYHVPPTLTPYTAEDKALDKTARRSAQEADRVMMEKNMALDLIEGFAVALKHHLRGEPTMYHEDLYHLLTPMHDHRHSLERSAMAAAMALLPQEVDTPGSSTPEGATPQPPQLADAGSTKPKDSTAKYRPTLASRGKNLPLNILRCLSEWISVLEDRGTVPGTSMGNMLGTLSAFEDNLTSLEKILTVPLPFVYSVHINTVWIYLFFLPFQLVKLFQWYSIPGVTIAAFIYLGFIAAGEEIEQPFGYDENDLDLDHFCQEIIHADIEQLRSYACLNAIIPESERRRTHRSMTLVEATGMHLPDSRHE